MERSVHAQAMKAHAIMRAATRCGSPLNSSGYEALCLLLQRQQPVMVDIDGHRVYRVTLPGRHIAFALWSDAEERIMTFFPSIAWVKRVPTGERVHA